MVLPCGPARCGPAETHASHKRGGRCDHHKRSVARRLVSMCWIWHARTGGRVRLP